LLATRRRSSRASFCFINPDGQVGGSGIPLFRTLSIDGLPLFSPRKLSKTLGRPGPLNEERIEVMAEVLIELSRLPDAARSRR
jgi:hypothetical protein